jgi:hypothetical protein
VDIPAEPSSVVPTRGLGRPENGRPADSLAGLLGGGRAAVDAALPPAAFAAGWFTTGRSLGWGIACAIATAGVTATARYWRGGTATAALVSVLGVVAAALVVLRTGHAADFFLVQIVTNAASALAWTASITVRWPLLGLIVGAALRQRTRWRRDPALLRAYSLASWVWVGQYLLRLAVFVPLWAAEQVVALGVARVALSWPLVAATLAGSWWVLRRALPSGHPGIRRPQTGRSPRLAASSP